jgi:MoxR-like ATPase
MDNDVKAIASSNTEYRSAAEQAIARLRHYVAERIVGQEQLVERLLVALLCDGHLLVEGAPGLAKTRAIRVLAEGIEADFHRVQFTPDLLPGDLTGTEVFRPQEGGFHFQRGPLFHNLVLADEVNRAPAKVQSALLEAMAERQITVGRETFKLPKLFLVMATQNPIEQEGTYPLPEAQLDRFLMHVRVDCPSEDNERQILRLARQEAVANLGTVPASGAVVTQAQLFAARAEVLGLYLAENVENYMIQLVMATREPGRYNERLAGWLSYGASPRATIALDRCARGCAWLAGRDYVTPADVQAVAPEVLRHRIVLSYEGEAEGVTADALIEELLRVVPVP